MTVLCGVGLYASLFMLRKTIRAERGELNEPSVVQTGRARLFGTPNALLGALYYPALALALWLPPSPLLLAAILAAAGLAAVTSVVLAYSLLFVTRMPCLYCWTSHVVNWSLLIPIAATVHPSLPHLR
jgi:uncharacterized membrane protein